MQSRRLEDYMPQSPAAAEGAKLRDRRFELGPDPYLVSRRNVPERSPRSRRSLSPNVVEGSRRVTGRAGSRSNSAERRGYDWHSGGGRVDRVRSRSPPFGQVRKRAHFDDGSVMDRNSGPLEFRRKYEFAEFVDFNADSNTSLKYGYDHSTSRIIKEEGFSGGHGGHGMSVQKLMTMEDGTVRGLSRLPPDLGPTSNYREIGGNVASSSRNLDISLRYRNPLPPDKLSLMESYKEGDKPVFYSRDVSYPMVSASQSKDFMSASHFKDFASISSGISRGEFPGFYRDGPPLPSDELPRSSGKLTEPAGFNGYGQRALPDSGRDPEVARRDLTYYHRDTRSHDYLYPKLGERESDDFGYPSDEIYRMMPPRAQVDFDHRDSLRPSIMDRISDNIDNTEGSRRNMRKSSLWDHPSSQKQTVSNHLDMSRTSNTLKQGGEYLGSGSAHVDFGQRVLRDREILHLGASRGHEISHLRSDYGFGRNAGPGSHKERLKSSPAFKDDPEMHRLAIRPHRMKAEELDIYDTSERVPKRKYSMDEEISRHNNTRSIMSSKWKMHSGTQYLNDSGEEWIGEDVSGLFSSETLDFDHSQYRKGQRTFDGTDRHRGFASDDWLSYQDPLEHGQGHSIESYKRSGKYIKGPPRPGSLSWHNSYHLDRKSVLHKPHNVWRRSKDDHHLDIHANDVDPSEDWESSAKSEPPEDSEEFKQLVHSAFLKFSKKLNENPAVRRRYKEQGKAGSLFCIVCSRSLSKEFMDTQRLVTHAFMSHKFGLRARHLGLHKAICVLLGWSSVVVPDTITWVPQVIPTAEALAQKEDLILWPPLIIIHNRSILNSTPEEGKVLTTEALGAFLRGKGFSGGKFKVLLGNHANNSIMVVKFMGTFSGLQDAERLHKYYAENKRGRTDLEELTSNKGKSSNSGEAGIQGDKVEELVLYGYMGIAEDLDKVDFDTKRRCLIKSRKEIQDLADAPVKPE